MLLGNSSRQINSLHYNSLYYELYISIRLKNDLKALNDKIKKLLMMISTYFVFTIVIVQLTYYLKLIRCLSYEKKTRDYRLKGIFSSISMLGLFTKLAIIVCIHGYFYLNSCCLYYRLVGKRCPSDFCKWFRCKLNQLWGFSSTYIVVLNNGIKSISNSTNTYLIEYSLPGIDFSENL
jgi:hypothetical protein